MPMRRPYELCKNYRMKILFPICNKLIVRLEGVMVFMIFSKKWKKRIEKGIGCKKISIV